MAGMYSMHTVLQDAYTNGAVSAVYPSAKHRAVRACAARGWLVPIGVQRWGITAAGCLAHERGAELEARRSAGGRGEV